jgi:putative transposase
VLRGFKTFSSKEINNILSTGEKFFWQKSFYDRIIRDEKELYNIRKYIEQNPLKWEFEKNVPGNLFI